MCGDILPCHTAAQDRTKRKAASVSAADNAGEAEKINWALFDIKGTCTELEKSYFRLHAPPHPFTVRPPRVLEKALARLLRLIRMGQVKYIYAADQFKVRYQILFVIAHSYSGMLNCSGMTSCLPRC